MAGKLKIGITGKDFLAWRKRRGIYQFQAGELIGVSERQISYYENRGKISRTVWLLCCSLDREDELEHKIMRINKES